MTSQLSHITTCTLCGQRFTAPASLIIGQEADRRTVQYVQGLAKHFERKHVAEYIEAAKAGHEYIGLLVLSHFVTDDPELNRLSEMTRHRIHERSTSRRVGNETIARQVAALALPIDEAQTAALCAMIQDMRDILQEVGQFAPGGVPLAAPDGRPPA